MQKTIAIPLDVLQRNDPEELAAYGQQPLTTEDLVQIGEDAQQEEQRRLNALPSFLAGVRRRRVTDGFTVPPGIKVYTDAESVATLTALRVLAKEYPDYTVNFKSNGQFYTLTAAQIIDIANAARAHVQKCFDVESQVLESLTAGSLTTEAAIEQTFDSLMAL